MSLSEKSSDFSDADKALLIEYFHAHPILWDHENAEYGKRIRRDQEIQIVAKELKEATGREFTPYDVKNNWSTLRIQYNRCKRQFSETGEAGKWKFFQAMSFLDDGGPNAEVKPVVVKTAAAKVETVASADAIPNNNNNGQRQHAIDGTSSSSHEERSDEKRYVQPAKRRYPFGGGGHHQQYADHQNHQLEATIHLPPRIDPLAQMVQEIGDRMREAGPQHYLHFKRSIMDLLDRYEAWLCGEDALGENILVDF